MNIFFTEMPLGPKSIYTYHQVQVILDPNEFCEEDIHEGAVTDISFH